jgi:uncharacterized membrane protein YccC
MAPRRLRADRGRMRRGASIGVVVAIAVAIAVALGWLR